MFALIFYVVVLKRWPYLFFILVCISSSRNLDNFWSCFTFLTGYCSRGQNSEIKQIFHVGTLELMGPSFGELGPSLKKKNNW